MIIKVFSLVNGVDVIAEIPDSACESNPDFLSVRNPMSMHVMIEPSVIDTQVPQKKLTFAPLNMFGVFTRDVVLRRDHVIYACDPQPQLLAEYVRQVNGFQRTETVVSP